MAATANTGQDAQVAAAVEAAAAASTLPEITNEWESKLKPGLKFKLDKVSKYALHAVRSKIVRPQPPIVYLEEKGRDEPNPNHPEYIMALTDYSITQSIASVDTYLALGTELVGELPNGMYPYTADEWTGKFEAMGVDIPTSQYPRYIAWIKLYAVPDDEEIGSLIAAIRRYNGVVLEDEVNEAVENLKSDNGRSADSEATPAETASIG